MWGFFPTCKRRGLSCHRLLYSVDLIPLCGKIVTSGAIFPFLCHCFPSEIQMVKSQAFASSMGLSLLTPVTSMLISDSSNILCFYQLEIDSQCCQ